jgi:glycosyltransferase involved in cell wall biosynthesis
MMLAKQIVINGRFIDQPITGVQRYALEICRALDGMIEARHAAVSALSFLVARPKRVVAAYPFRNIEEARFGRFNGYAWEQIDLPSQMTSAVIVNLCNLCPLLGRTNLTVVHDANAWLIPDNYSLPFRLAYYALVPLGIRRSRAWVTVSQYSADQLLARRIANRPPDAIIGSGSDHVRALSGRRSILAQSGLPHPFVFALGSLSRNKNVDLVRSLAPALGAKGISIVIAGDPGSRIFTKQNCEQQRNIMQLGRVHAEDLAFLFRNCLCFLFPSYFEGFGIPPIEAMALGAPVVSSNTSSLPEILGDAALYCSPDNASVWIEAITRLTCDSNFRAALISRGLTQASKYEWCLSAERLLQLVRQLNRDGRRPGSFRDAASRDR